MEPHFAYLSTQHNVDAREWQLDARVDSVLDIFADGSYVEEETDTTYSAGTPVGVRRSRLSGRIRLRSTDRAEVTVESRNGVPSADTRTFLLTLLDVEDWPQIVDSIGRRYWREMRGEVPPDWSPVGTYRLIPCELFGPAAPEQAGAALEQRVVCIVRGQLSIEADRSMHVEVRMEEHDPATRVVSGTTLVTLSVPWQLQNEVIELLSHDVPDGPSRRLAAVFQSLVPELSSAGLGLRTATFKFRRTSAPGDSSAPVKGR